MLANPVRQTYEVDLMIRAFTQLFMVFLTGIASVQAMEQANTLGSNEAISNALVESLVDDSEAKALLDAPYKGFYQIESKVKNSKIVFSNVETKLSYPDERWEIIATEIASLVQMPAYSTGSRIDPRATAYVVFYDVDLPGVDRSSAIYLPTSAYSEPNTLAVLLIDHDNHSSTRDALGTRLRSAHQNTDRILLFELAM